MEGSSKAYKLIKQNNENSSTSYKTMKHLQIHMSKARKLQLQLDDAEERAEMAEANYLKMKDVLVAEKEKRN